MDNKDAENLMESQMDIWNKASAAALADGQIDKREMQELKNTLGNLRFKNTKNKKEMTESHFNMWRLVVSAVHADGDISPEEVNMIEQYIEDLDFDQKQKKIITTELKHPSSLEEILQKITDPGDRSQSLYFVRLLLWRDKILTDTESDFLKKVSDHFSQLTDTKKLQEQLEQLKEKNSKTEELVYAISNSPVIQFLKKFPFFSRHK